MENEVSSKRPRLSSQDHDNDNDLPRVGLDTVKEDTTPPMEVFGASVNDNNEFEETDTSESEVEESVPAPNYINQDL